MTDDVKAAGFGLPQKGGKNAKANAVEPKSSAPQAPAVPDGAGDPQASAEVNKVFEPMLPKYTREMAVENLAAMQSIYDFEDGTGVEVLEFLKRSRYRVSVIKFRGIEINNFTYVDVPQQIARSPEEVQAALFSLKGV